MNNNKNQNSPSVRSVHSQKNDVRTRQNLDTPTTPVVRAIGSFDKVFLITVLILVAFGTVMVFSASYAYAANYMGDSYHYIKRHLIFAIAGVVIMYGLSFLDYKIIKLFSVPIFAVATILMILVTLVGEAHKGATRWISIGPIQFQPSELLKIAIIIVLADYISHNFRKITSNNLRERLVYGFGTYMGFAVLIAVLFVLQKHLSGCIIALGLVICMMFLGGSDWKVIGIVVAVVAIAGVIFVPILLKHSMDRFAVWFDPFSDILNKGWQPSQSLYAVTSGGFWGVGFGASKQKQLYLSEPQNDYIFAILIEELGFIGGFAVICLFIFLIYRGIKIAFRAPDRFSSLLVAGIVFQIGIQTMLNICVITNTIPSTGISLPFFSYGGTSLLILLAEMGIVLNVSRYSLIEK